MKNLIQHALLAFLFIVLFSACQNNQPKPQPELLDIKLMRGDLVMCAGDQFGEVSFSLSCDVSVRETFNLAVALLHSFEYREAEKAFVKVLDMDPDCAMAYWGVAMSIYHELWFQPSDDELKKGSKILQIAEDLPKTEKESMYINAISSFYNNWETLDHKTRAKVYESEMEAFYKKYADDPEVAIFYALALNSTADPTDANLTNQRKAGGILEELFKGQPNHPGIAHYIIHNYDNPVLAHRALPTARKYADIAPSSAHAQHMPSHIFTRLGLWDESITSNVNSKSSSQCYTEELGLEGAYFEEVHAMDYLVYAYLQKGDNKKASEEYEYLKTMHELNPLNVPISAYPFAAIPARIALENKDWEAAAKVEIHESDMEWEKFPWQKAILHFTRAIGSARSGAFEDANEEIAIMTGLRDQLVEKEDSYKANQIMIQINSAKAWLEFEQGNQAAGLVLMEKAAELEKQTNKHPVTPGEVLPAEELLGEMLLALNKPEEALIAFEGNLKSRPNRFNSLYGAAKAAQKLGDNELSREYFSHLINQSSATSSVRPELSEARKAISDS